MVFVVIVAAMSFSVRISSLSLHGYLDGLADEANGYSSSDFEQKAKSQLCSIDAEAVIESKEWQDFIREEQGIP